jgi:hypothetical protein
VLAAHGSQYGAKALVTKGPYRVDRVDEVREACSRSRSLVSTVSNARRERCRMRGSIRIVVSPF